MLDQSRDVSLVGGGELTVLPLGIDIEAMRTGGVGGMFFGIDRSRFLTRQILGGLRHQEQVKVVSPVIEGKLLYLRHNNRTVAVRAGGEIPSRAQQVGASLDVHSGRWLDSPGDSAYMVPTTQQFYDELDRFHVPSRRDSTWGEWHYFNLVISRNEWWYITYLVGGEVGSGEWGGHLLLTHRHPDGRYEQFNARAPSSRVIFDTLRADVSIGKSYVRQQNGTYVLHADAKGRSGRVRIDVSLIPDPIRYFPSVELYDGAFLSGYVVPALSAKASGKVCEGRACSTFSEVPAYHDHNWGYWRDVTWEWGTGRGERFNLLYGGVYTPGADDEIRSSTPSSPFFFTLVDSLGVNQVLRFSRILYEGARAAAGGATATAPTRFSLLATSDADTVRLVVNTKDVLATRAGASDPRRVFLQMRGRFDLSGKVAGQVVADSGMGFFETWVGSNRP